MHTSLRSHPIRSIIVQLIMTSQACAETLSLASNEEFTDYRETSYYHNTVDLHVARRSSDLPLSMAEELIPRLDRVIRLLEAQLEMQQSSGETVTPKRMNVGANEANTPKTMKTARNYVKAAKKRGRKRAKTYPVNRKNTFTMLDSGTARETYNNLAKWGDIGDDRVQTYFTTCWPETRQTRNTSGPYNKYPRY